MQPKNVKRFGPDVARAGSPKRVKRRAPAVEAAAALARSSSVGNTSAGGAAPDRPLDHVAVEVFAAVAALLDARTMLAAAVPDGRLREHYLGSLELAAASVKRLGEKLAGWADSRDVVASIDAERKGAADGER